MIDGNIYTDSFSFDQFLIINKANESGFISACVDCYYQNFVWLHISCKKRAQEDLIDRTLPNIESFSRLFEFEMETHLTVAISLFLILYFSEWLYTTYSCDNQVFQSYTNRSEWSELES